MLVRYLLLFLFPLYLTAEPPAKSDPFQLIVEIQNKRFSKAKQLIRSGAIVNVEDPVGYTPLMVAARKGNEELVKLLLERGADPNAKADDGWTALMSAAAEKHDDVVKLLLAHKAKVNVRADNDEIPLTLAMKFQCGPIGDDFGRKNANAKDEIVRRLIEAGADVNAESEGQPMLVWAAFLARDSSVRRLLEHGADVKARSDLGESALYYAVATCGLDTVRLLLEAGGEVNDRTKDGETPLMLAARSFRNHSPNKRSDRSKLKSSACWLKKGQT